MAKNPWAELLGDAAEEDVPFNVSRGSWYSQAPGWVDRQDRPGSNALGVPDEQQGIALPSRATLGQWFDVQDPEGRTHRLQQTDVGPAKWTGRGVDISAAAASRAMGYTPQTFPTDKPFGVRPASGPPETQVAGPWDELLKGDSGGVSKDHPWSSLLGAPTESPSPPATAPSAATPGLLDYPLEAAKQFGVGAIEAGVALPLRGAATGSAENRGLQSAIEAIQQGADIDEAVQRPPAPATPATESGLYQAGEAVSKAIGSDLPSPILHPVVTDLARGFGSLAGGIISTVPTLGAGPVLAGRGEALQTAVEKGATPEQQEQAAQVGSAAGATDFADLLLATTGSTGKALGLLNRVGKKVLSGFLIEGGQEGFQKGIQNAIEKGVYNPEKDVFEDVPYEAFIGGVVGGTVKGIGGLKKPEEPAAPVPSVEESATEFSSRARVAPVPPTLTPAPESTPEGDKIPRPVTPEAAIATVPGEGGVLRMPDGGEIRYSEAVQPEPVFYSKLYRVASEKLPGSASGKQIESTLRNNGVKVEEIEDTGLSELLGRAKVSKAEVMEHLEEHGIEVEETFTTDKGGFPVQSAYIAPGPNSGYVELRLKVPEKPGTLPYQDPHWRDDKNVVAHVQATTRHDKAGQPVLHIEGLQSTGHQAGREAGYLTPEEETRVVGLMQQRAPLIDAVNRLSVEYKQAQKELTIANVALMRATGSVLQRPAEQALAAAGAKAGNLQSRIQVTSSNILAFTREINKIRTSMDGPARLTKTPGSLPFKSAWVELAVKRTIRWAADNGYTKISWNNGSLAAGWNTGAKGDLSQLDAKTINGIKYFYDSVIPSRMKAAVKRFGGVLGATDIVVGPGPELMRVEHVTIPVAARTDIQRSVPMYQHPVSGPAANVVVHPAVVRKVKPSFVAAAKKMGDAFNSFAKQFGLEQKITLHVVTDSIVVPGFPANTTSYGMAWKFPNGTYGVWVRADLFADNIARFYSVMMHEFGHVVVWDKFAALPDATKLLMIQEYQDWRKAALAARAQPGSYQTMLLTKSPAAMQWLDSHVAGGQTLDSLDPDVVNYNLSDLMTGDDTGFHEYLAERIASWATTVEEPLSVVEKAYSGIGKALRLFMEWMATKFGIDPRPSLLITNWLNSFLTSARTMTPQEYAALDIRTQKTNQYYVQQDSGDPNATGVAQSAPVATVMAGVSQAFGGNPPQSAKVAAAHASKINKLYEYAASILDLVQKNPNFTPLVRYVERVRMKDQIDKQVQDPAIDIAKSWRGLGRKNEEKLGEFLDEITNMTYLTQQERQRGVQRHPTQQEVRSLAARIGMTPKAMDVAARVRKFNEWLLDLTSDLRRAEAAKITDPTARIAALTEINGLVAQLKSKPYFPFMRFGRHFVTGRNAAGTVIYFDTFERKGLLSAERQQQKKLADLRANAAPGDEYKDGMLPKTAEVFSGLPGPLLSHIRDKLSLTPDQLDALQQLQFQLSPTRSFKHHFQHKRYVPGYSRDFLRAFSRYAFSGARYYSRAKFADDLKQDVRDAGLVGGNKASRIRDFMQDHLDKTVLDSKGDYGLLKGAMFLWAMGYSWASAMLNATQTPMVTFPYLSSKFGDLKTSRIMARVMTDMTNFYKKGSYAGQQDWELRSFGYVIKTGRIVETQAAELSALGQGGILNLGATSEIQRGANFVLEKSAYMFETVEQFNRRVAFRSALRLAYENPGAKIVDEAVSRYPGEVATLVNKEGFTTEQARAIVTAGHIVDRTQFVYAAWARPKIMRGRVGGSIFIFKRYLQSLMFLLGSDSKFAMRYILIAALAGGMGGLPYYEDLKNLIQAMLRYLGYNADAEVFVRQMVKDYTDDTIPGDMVLHGFARRGFGIPALLDALGGLYTGRPGRGLDMTKPAQNIPFPQLDRSKAVTSGPIIPEQVWQLIDPSKEVNESVGGANAVLGYGFSAATNMLKAITDKHLAPSDPKRWEKAEPRALASLSKMYRAYTEGRERTGGPAGGTTVTKYNVSDPEQLMEVIALGLGYNDLRRSNEWNRIMAQSEHSKYIEMRRKGLLEAYYEAYSGDNADDMARADRKIDEFNDGLGDADVGMRITAKTMKQSFERREKGRISREENIPIQKSKRPIAEAFEELYPRTIEMRPR